MRAAPPSFSRPPPPLARARRKSENVNKTLPPPVIPVKAAAPKAAPAAAAGGFAVKMGAPRTAVEGLRVVTEFHTKDTQAGAVLSIGEGTLKHEVYIYACKCVRTRARNRDWAARPRGPTLTPRPPRRAGTSPSTSRPR